MNTPAPVSSVPASLPTVLRSKLSLLGLDSTMRAKLASFVEGDLVIADIWPGDPVRLFWGAEGMAITSDFMDKRGLHRVVIDSPSLVSA